MKTRQIGAIRALFTALILAGLLTQAPLAYPREDNLTKSLGHVSFETSCSPALQKPIQQSVALLHHMMYEQARNAFLKIIEQDKSCAMAYWGLAMSRFHPLWAPPLAAELADGRAAIEKAQAIGGSTPREQAYLDAIAIFYEGWDAGNHREKLRAWEKALGAIYREFPGDIDAGAFYALSLLATAPKTDRQYRQQRRAGEILESLLERASQHPGLHHYLIHAYDNPILALRPKALEVARAYDKIAPEVPHALHMPSHIFVRLGKWPETIDWNIRSARAALAQPVSDGMTSLHYYHALDYLMYAHLQQGNDRAAAAVLEQVMGAGKAQDSFASAYGIAAARTRLPLETRNWEVAASLVPRSHKGFPWDKYPWAEALVYFAQGIGAARSGDSSAARKAARNIKDLQQKVEASNERYWATVTGAREIAVRAWADYAAGDEEQALAMMVQAADLEDSVDKHPVSPGSVLPARELFGDMLMLAGRPAEALVAYEKSLQKSPGRYNSLYGAIQAATLAGETERAARYLRALAGQLHPDSQRRPPESGNGQH
ncbi:tetratricopeptide repeat protein [Biformimicrobium ophioploci]|uniref:tetratricopeptide repeat protein n=1 Tax=Biformimicrobium ophioploci TaxID=3036711 RepID=UPI00255425B9|nr:tetratricopeptide repeat protein [Microbulbifer sp. NKW57]